VSDLCASWRRDQSWFIPTLIGAAPWPAGGTTKSQSLWLDFAKSFPWILAWIVF
jgi:hypothetical protein